MSQNLLHIVCDYKAGGMEFAEIQTKLLHYLDPNQQLSIVSTSVPALDTVALGFVTAQYALSPFVGSMFVYGNAAPRRTATKAIHNNADHGIKYAKLKNGAEIINVNSDFAFGFIKDEIEVFRNIDCPNSGSQFRSRDFFPEQVAKIINGDDSSLTEDLSIADIPDIPHNLVTWTDGFGNIKTSMRLSDLKQQGFEAGEKVQVILNGVSMLGVIATGGFSVDRGVLAVNIGSSGFDDPFVELFLRVHKMSEKTAAVRFAYPIGGSEVIIKKLE